ncbi:MAG: DUF3848 domain-containing protein [Ruminococcus sp.]|nr:DUF3848 domain-containing protein [Ruminococcus sp.]
MKKDYNRLLYEKMEKEYEDYVSSVKEMSVEQIINNAYKIAVKEDILMIFYDSKRPQKEAKALYGMKYPLDYLYERWMKESCSQMDLIVDSVNESIKKAVREMKERGER